MISAHDSYAADDEITLPYLSNVLFQENEPSPNGRRDAPLGMKDLRWKFDTIDEGLADISSQLSDISPNTADGKTYIWDYSGRTPLSVFSFKGTITSADIDAIGLADGSNYYAVRVGTDVSAIGDGAFFDKHIWEVELPWTLEEIGVSAFGASKVSYGQMRCIDIYGRDQIQQYHTTAIAAKEHGTLTIKSYAFANQQNANRVHLPHYALVNLEDNSFYNFKIYLPTVVGHGIFFDDNGSGFKDGQLASTLESWYANYANIGWQPTDIRAYLPVDYEWVEKQKYGQIPWVNLSSWTWTR